MQKITIFEIQIVCILQATETPWHARDVTTPIAPRASGQTPVSQLGPLKYMQLKIIRTIKFVAYNISFIIYNLRFGNNVNVFYFQYYEMQLRKYVKYNLNRSICNSYWEQLQYTISAL